METSPLAPSPLAPSPVPPAEIKTEAKPKENGNKPESVVAETPMSTPATPQPAAATTVIVPVEHLSESPDLVAPAPEFEAPRFEARPNAERTELPKTDSTRASETTRDSGVARITVRPSSGASSNSSAQTSGVPATDAAPRRSPVRPDGQTRVRSGNSAQNGGEDNDVFRRSDTINRQESRVRPPAKETWWDKLKHFLGFEKVDD